MTAKPVPEHISDGRLAEIIKGCEGVTPGPWTYGAQWLCRRKPGPADDYEYLAQVPLNDYDSPRWNRDAAHLSRLDPQTVLSLLIELQHRREAEAGILAQDVIDLVIAARMVAYEDQSPEAIRALDKAAEAFAERVGWENDPDDEALSVLGEHP